MEKLSKDIYKIVNKYLDYSYASLLKNRNKDMNKDILNKYPKIIYELKKYLQLEDALLLALRNGYTGIIFDHDTYHIASSFYKEINKKKMNWLDTNPCSSWKYIGVGKFYYNCMIDIKCLNVLDITIQN